MKRTILIILTLLCLLSACHTQERRSADGVPLTFYFPAEQPNGKQTLLSTTVSYPDGPPSVQALMQDYLQMQIPMGALPAIPATWIHKSTLRQANGTLSIVFEGTKASAIDASLAVACLSKTFLQLENILSISLLHPGLEKPLELTENDILLEDSAMLPQKEQVVLYFPDEELRYLQRETRTVDVMDVEQKANYILQALLSGTSTGKPHACIPKGTTLLKLTIEQKLCIVNLSSEFSQNLEESYAAERLAVYSIVNSLTELDEIDSVDIWVANAPLERLSLMELKNSLQREERLLRTDGTDVTIYPFYDADKKLISVPLTLQTEDSTVQAEQLLQALLSYEDKSGLPRCIPQGTQLFTVRVEDGVCIIDLTAEFLSGCKNEEEEMLAVHAVLATVFELQDIHSAEILVEGLPPAYRDSRLSRIRVPAKNWFPE